MSLNCRIEMDRNGGVKKVIAPNGKESELFKSLKRIIKDKALDVYAITETEGFKKFTSSLRFAASRPQTQPLEDSQKQTAKLVTEYLKSKGQNINILSEEDMLAEVRKRGYDSLNAMISFNFSDLPKDIKEFLEKEYGRLITNFDWNTTMDSFTDSSGNFNSEAYNEWLEEHRETNFNKNRPELIRQLKEDINLQNEQKKADKRLEAFEELIIPSLGSEIQNPVLNKLQEAILMDYNLSAEEISEEMKKAKGVLDESGSIIPQSDIFKGGGVNLPNFEKFVEKNPEYQDVFNDWKKLFDESTNLSIKSPNSFRTSVTKEEMQKALDYITLEASDKDIQFLNQGDQIYGFYDTNTGEIYLTEELLSSENLVHELYHSFSPILKQKSAQGDQTAKEVLNQMEVLSLEILGGEQVIKDRFERDINILITPATVRSFNEETAKLKTLTENYNNIAQEIAEGNLQNQDKFISLQQEILETYQNEIENKVKDIEGVAVNFNSPYMGSWQGSYEPSLNMSLKISKKANTNGISQLLFDLAENTSQDAFILEEASDIPIEKLPLTIFDDNGFMHYPQLRVNFDKNLSVESKSKIAQDLIKKGIKEFSIDGDYLIVSVINFSENINEKQQDYDNKLESIKGTFTVGEEYGTEKVRNVQSYIRKSQYIGARNEGDEQSQTRQYDRSDLFKKEINKNSLLSSEYSSKPKYVLSEENSSNYANMTEDNQGNFVFYHRGQKGYNTIKPGTGQNVATSREETSALNKVGGLSMYYTRPEDSEQGVGQGTTYMVKIPRDRVYDFNTDPLSFLKEAEDLHEKENPGKAFDLNTQLAYVTKIAANNGFDMVVAEWAGKTRAQTTKELKPVDTEELESNVLIKKFEENYKSNSEKGFAPIIPETKTDRLKSLYDRIYSIRNNENKYDKLYHLYHEYNKYTQEEITDMIEGSNLPSDLKEDYKKILESKDEGRKSEIKFMAGLDSEVYNPREGETYEQYRDRMIDEASAILLQKNSVQYFERIAKENGLNEAETKSFIQRIKDFIKDFGKWLTQQLGLENTSPEEIANLTQRELFDRITTSMLNQSQENIQLKYNSKGQHLAPNGKPSNLTEAQAKQARTKAFKDWSNDWKDVIKDNNGEPAVLFHGSDKLKDITVFNSDKGNDYSFFTSDKYEAQRYLTQNSVMWKDTQGIGEFFIKANKTLNIRDFRLRSSFIDSNDISPGIPESLQDYINKNANDILKEANDFAALENEMFFEDYEWLLDDETKSEKEITKEWNILRPSEKITKILEKGGNDWKILETKTLQNFLKLEGYDSFVTNEGDFNIAVYNPNQIKSATDNIGTFDPNNNDIRFQVIGEKGAKKIEDYKKRLDKAKNLEKKGVSLSEISDRTGWYKFQGDWRLFSNEALEQFKINEDAIKEDTEQKLSDILSTDNILYDMYPALREVKIKVSQNPKLPNQASYSEEKNLIETNLFKGHGLQAAIAHELTHFVQREEALPTGADINTLQNQLGSQLGFIPKGINIPTPVLVNELKKNRNKDNESTVNALLSLIGDSSEQNRYKVYRAVLGEVDAHLVTTAYQNYKKGQLGETYEFLLEDELEGINIKPNDVIKLQGTSVSNYAPTLQEMTFGDTVIKYSKAGNKLNLEEIKTPTEKRGRGSARKALRQFLKIADNNDLTVKLVVAPRDKSTDESKLKEFYQSEGFEFDSLYGFPSDFEMTRIPQAKRPVEQKGEEFSKYFDKNGEPLPNVVSNYAHNTNVTMSAEEKTQALNLAMSLGTTNKKEFINKLKQNFDKQGFIVFSKSKMTGLKDNEKNSILSNEEYQDNLQRIIQGVKNSDNFYIPEYNKTFVLKNTIVSDIGIETFKNPYVVEKEILSQVAGKDPKEALSEEYIQEYNNNPDFKSVVDGMAKDYKLIKNFTIKDGSLVTIPEINTEMLIEEGADLTKLDRILPQISYITGLEEGVYNSLEEDVYTLVEELEKKTLDSGLDLEGLTNLFQGTTREDFNSYLNSLASFIENPKENISTFAEKHNDFFYIEEGAKETPIKTEDANDIIVENPLSEEEMYDSFGLVKVEGNHYKNLKKENLEVLYQKVYSAISPNQTLSEYADYVRSHPVKEEIFLYKQYFNIKDFKKQSYQKDFLEVSQNFEGDYGYLTTQFISDFYSNMIKNKEDYFYSNFELTEKGIVLRSNDPITKQIVLDNVPIDIKDNFYQYVMISKNISLDLQNEINPSLDYSNLTLQRIEAIMDTSTLPKPQDYQKVSEKIVATNISKEGFIQIDNNPYELLQEIGDKSIYVMLEKSDPNYIPLLSETKPSASMDINELNYLVNEPNYNFNKNDLYSKKELEGINQENFNC